MKLVVISCWKYRDAWKPFFELLTHFWPDCPYPKYLVVDYLEDGKAPPLSNVEIVASNAGAWCDCLKSFAEQYPEEPILLFQEDFFLAETVRTEVIECALAEFKDFEAGCLRLYPMPGAELDYGSREFGLIPPGARYRISCQAAIWDPKYLVKICEVGGMASRFELRGSVYSYSLPEPVLAWKRDVTPWPLEYICSAISKGLWDPNAKRLCDSVGIDADFSMRAFA